MENYPNTELYKVINVITMPHPYCLTPGHICFASDNYGGILSEEAVKAFETKKARGCCGVKGCKLLYDEHEFVILVQVDFPGDLKDAPGLQDYLKSCLPNMEKLNHVGFIFIRKEQQS